MGLQVTLRSWDAAGRAPRKRSHPFASRISRPPPAPLQLGCIAEGGNPTNPKGWGPPHTGMRLPRPPGSAPQTVLPS